MSISSRVTKKAKTYSKKFQKIHSKTRPYQKKCSPLKNRYSWSYMEVDTLREKYSIKHKMGYKLSTY